MEKKLLENHRLNGVLLQLALDLSLKRSSDLRDLDESDPEPSRIDKSI